MAHSRTHAVLVVICVGVGTAVLLATAVPWALERSRTTELRATTRAAHAAVRPEWDRVLGEDAAVLAAVLGPPRHRSRSVRCSLDDDEAGLMVQNYRQVCSLRSVDLYPTDQGFQPLAVRLGAAAAGTPAAVRLSVAVSPVPAHGCGVLRASGSEGPAEVSVVVTRLEAGQFVAADDPSALVQPCAAPQAEYDTGAVRFDQTYAPADLTRTRSWVAVVHQTQFLDQDLGCRGVLFCSSPVDGPVLP